MNASNYYKIEIGTKCNDAPGNLIAQRIRNFLNIPLKTCQIVHVYWINGLNSEQADFLIKNDILSDPVLQSACLGNLPFQEVPDWFAEVSYKPGVTDNEARTAREIIALALNIDKENFTANSGLEYRFFQEDKHPLKRKDIERICRELLCNELIQNFKVMDFKEWKENVGSPILKPDIKMPEVKTYDLESLDDKDLIALSNEHTWALNLAEMLKIKSYFKTVSETRKNMGLSDKPTDVEVEVIAQTWSEHCKHKIFSALINYRDLNSGRNIIINNLYKTYIRDITALIRKQKGHNDYCLSVFKDNAGVIQFIPGYDACIKVETHNSPSALDPYGGALTGIVGVNRDPMGTGMGANLIANLDVFCFARPDYEKILPPRILHPGRILEGVRQGVEDGGNQSGIPTINGSLVFDDRFLGKPLVFCGTIGLLPDKVCGHPGYEKSAKPGDIIVMVGGRIGKDGIHGATFSSEELHINSPITAVQIGDPITQRKMYDFILRARDACLYNSITDNGAGGLSSSVGEMAEETGGCVLDLSKAPLKYPGLAAWEILLSEAQERMTLAVPPDKLNAFLALAKQMDVEATPLGTFNDSGFFEIRYKDRTVGLLSMEFLHHGCPQMELNATWGSESAMTMEDKDSVKHSDTHNNITRADIKIGFDDFANFGMQWQNEFINKMLRRFNVCSKEKIIRQYDHEVGGGSVIKPLTGLFQDGPTDAAVLRPLLESDSGLVISHGICPKYSDIDTYWMMANAMDEAIRNAVAVGANPDYLAGVDNFCWCDPIKSPKNPDGEFKLAQLARACMALSQFALAFGTPCISGKDSMKNDYVEGNLRISIPPTVLFTVMGVIDNVTRTQTSDFKNAGDHIYLLGATWNEMGASEAASELNITCKDIPQIDAHAALTRYRALYSLMQQRVISTCHDCSDGGFATALAEMCIGGRLGCEIDLNKIKTCGKINAFEIMYSESASRHIVTVKPPLAPLLDALGMWQSCVHIGQVINEPVLKINSGDSKILAAPVEDLARSFKNGL